MALHIANRQKQSTESVVISVQGDTRGELEGNQPHRLAETFGQQLLGNCGISDVSPIYPVTKDGPYTTMPTSEEVKQNPIVGWRRDFKCLKRL